MPKPCRAPLAAALVLLTILPAVSTAVDDLASLKSRINELETSLAGKEIEYGSAREAVLEIERELHTARKENSRLRAELETKMQHIDALRKRRGVMNERREASISAIKRLLLARYKQSRHPRLKVLLDDDDIGEVRRKLRYYEYLADAENERIREQSTRVNELRQIEAALKLEATKLRRMRGQTEAQLSALNESFAKRTRAAKSLEALLRDNKKALEQMRRDENELTDLVEVVIDETETLDAATTPFSGLKGDLAWPTDGRIAKAPGSAMRDGGAKWSGVIIESSPGADVAAIAGGRVAFADWFRNLGLLVIIDHGNGYMSLYGHNRELHKAAGDNVRAGDIVASVGDTGGRISAGLYFEIRENGAPQDPRQWCRK